jgi:UDP:flavonoid glycosyltransferase YjiC (YdhE family)
VGEAATLAHVARPLALAKGLDTARYEVIFAADSRYGNVVRGLPFETRTIRSISCAEFLDALDHGRPLYELETLRGYVRDELALIEAVAPAAVVGDFRLSLAVSARVAKVPYLAISNAYWSPYARERFPMPDFVLSRRLGVPLARLLFRVVGPLAFRMHTIPLNRLSAEYGLEGPGPDLRKVYTQADHTLYADVPDLVPTFNLPANHHFLGPILWSPDVLRPPWWNELPRNRPIVYVTLGSSGRSALLEASLAALAPLPLTVLAATAGRTGPPSIPENAHVADYLPGTEAAALSRLVICNGGSPTTQQAIAAGVPVLGLAGNMDQHLNMTAVQRAGAGLLLRSEYADAAPIRAAVGRILDDPSFAANASRLAAIFSSYDAPRQFEAILARVIGLGQFRPSDEPAT